MAHEHDIDIEGACGGECACSTCHVLLEQDICVEEIFRSLREGGEVWPNMMALGSSPEMALKRIAETLS